LNEEQNEGPVTVEIDTDTAEGMAVLEGLGAGSGMDFSAASLLGVRPDEQVFTDLDELEEWEDRENDGYWVGWPAVPGARVLLAHPENAMVAWPQIERELRAKNKVKSDDDTPLHLILQGTGMAAFGRSIKGWEGFMKGGAPLEFNAINFMARWRRRRFRDFVNARWREFSTNPQGLDEEAGKG